MTDGLVIDALTGNPLFLVGGEDDTNTERITISRTVKIAFSALRCVYSTADGTVDLANPTDTAKSAVLGVTTKSYLIGERADILAQGILADHSFTWTFGTALFLSINGHIVHYDPMLDNLVRVGTATKVGEIYVKIEPLTVNEVPIV